MNQREYARFKRAMEWYSVDPAFREAVEKEPSDVLLRLGVTSEPSQVLDAISCILGGTFNSETAQENPYVKEYAHRNCMVSERVRQRVGRERFAADGIWQYSNIVRNRCRMENQLIRMHSNIYFYPAVFELSEGCRVQCPFCGLAAKPWSSDFRYTEENRTLWREVLQITRELLGNVIDVSPCYFATEPLDNPDYEDFLRDAREVTGGVPQTTTALAERYPERIRSLMNFLGKRELEENNALRISIRNLTQFHRIMELYTPEELENVELLPNNPESVYKYSRSGRAVKDSAWISKDKAICYSISCLAGIRLNMAARTIAFVEPEQPDSEYPLGIRTREMLSFQDAESYREGLIKLFRSYAFGSLPYYVPVQLNKNIHMETDEKEIRLLGDGIGYRIDRNAMLMDALALLKGGICPIELPEKVGAPQFMEEKLFQLLNELYIRGYLRLK